MNDRRIEKSKDSLRGALLLLVQKEQDISKISIKKLTETANVNRKTFYNHYQKIEDIFAEIDDTVQEHFARQLDDLLQSDSFDAPHIYEAMNRSMELFPEYHFTIIRMDSYWMQINRSINSLKEHILRFFASKKHLIHTDDIQYLNFYADYLSYGMIGLFHEWYISDPRISLEELTRLWDKVNGLGQIWKPE